MNPNPAEPAMPEELSLSLSLSLPAALGRADTRSRLRSGGLLRAAAGLAACAAAATAQASVVYSGEVNVPFYRLGAVVNVQLAPGSTLGLTGSYVGKDSHYVALYVSEAGNFNVLGTAADAQVAQALNAGFSVDGTSVYSQGDSPLRTQDSQAFAVDFFVGFNFDPTNAGVNYGWLHFIRNDGFTWNLADYAYENTGQAMVTGDIGGSPNADPNAIPEPGSLPLVAAAGAALVLMQRRRR